MEAKQQGYCCRAYAEHRSASVSRGQESEETMDVFATSYKA